MDILDLFLCPKRVQISVLQFAVSIKAKFTNFINLLIFVAHDLDKVWTSNMHFVTEVCI